MKTNEKSAGKFLFINTAAEQSRVVLFSSNKIIGEKILESRSELSNALLTEIDKLLKAKNFKPDFVAVFPGPGSYTGLRIGITTANFLSWSWNIPIYTADAEGKIMAKESIVLPIYLHDAKITKPKLNK